MSKVVTNRRDVEGLETLVEYYMVKKLQLPSVTCVESIREGTFEIPDDVPYVIAHIEGSPEGSYRFMQLRMYTDVFATLVEGARVHSFDEDEDRENHDEYEKVVNEYTRLVCRLEKEGWVKLSPDLFK